MSTVYSILFSLLAFVTTASATHYHVYLLGGQSNAAGRGDAADLLMAPLNAPQADVQLYWHKTLTGVINGNLTQDTWIDLQVGTGHGKNGPRGHAVEFGSELSFGRAMADADPTVNVAIIKYAHGGSNLHTQWADGGIYYKTFIATVRSGLSALTAAGHSYQLGGMIWVQGEADTRAGNARNYKAKLINLIDRVRSDLGKLGANGHVLPFIISGLSNSQYSDITTSGRGSYIVRQAQEAVARTRRQVAFVDTDGLSTYSNGKVHFDASAQIAIGQACAKQMKALAACGKHDR